MSMSTHDEFFNCFVGGDFIGGYDRLSLGLVISSAGKHWEEILYLAAIKLALDRTLSILSTPERDVTANLALLLEQLASAQGLSLDAQLIDSPLPIMKVPPELSCLENELQDAFRRSDLLLKTVFEFNLQDCWNDSALLNGEELQKVGCCIE
jgi:hypothetical protein